MKEGRIFFLANFARRLVSVVVAVAGQNDLCAVALGRLYLGDGGRFGHDDGCRNAELLGCTRNALCMVACRGGNNGAHTAVFHQSGNLVACASYFKGAGFLTVFALEINAAACHPRKSRGQVELGMVQHGGKSLCCQFKFTKGQIHGKHLIYNIYVRKVYRIKRQNAIA